MIRLLIKWVISALSLLIVTRVVPGFAVTSFSAALVAAVVIGLINGTVGFILKVITFPLSLITFGLFLLIINAVMLELAASFVAGFVVNGFAPAFWGSIVLSIVSMILRWFFLDKER